MSSTRRPALHTADVIARLITQYGYSPQSALETATKLLELEPSLQTIFRAWWENDEIDDTHEIAGFTAARLIAEYGMYPTGAFLTLAWLQREPVAARNALEEGFDDILFH